MQGFALRGEGGRRPGRRERESFGPYPLCRYATSPPYRGRRPPEGDLLCLRRQSRQIAAGDCGPRTPGAFNRVPTPIRRRQYDVRYEASPPLPLPFHRLNRLHCTDWRLARRALNRLRWSDKRLACRADGHQAQAVNRTNYQVLMAPGPSGPDSNASTTQVCKRRILFPVSLC
jgi:hypothetical protein